MERRYGNTRIAYFECDSTDEDFAGVLEEGEQALCIDVIETAPEHRGEGSAQKALETFLDDFNNRDILLVCCPKERGVEFSRLADFYTRNGFEMVDGLGEMPYPVMRR